MATKDKRQKKALKYGPYEIILCDPPWDYKGQKQHSGPGKKGDTGGAQTHYPTVTLDHLKKFNVNGLAAKDCLIFMWVSSPHLDQGIELMKSWGFQYATIAFIWHKEKTNPGFYTLSQCEICLVGKREKGKIPTPRGSRNVRQFLQEMRTEHSRKPDEVMHRIEKMFPTQSKIELFARRRMNGWDAWGLDLPVDSRDAVEILGNPEDLGEMKVSKPKRSRAVNTSSNSGDGLVGLAATNIEVGTIIC